MMFDSEVEGASRISLRRRANSNANDLHAKNIPSSAIRTFAEYHARPSNVKTNEPKVLTSQFAQPPGSPCPTSPSLPSAPPALS